MRIALDYDGTYTRDPAMWDMFIEANKAFGHEVFCCTMRYPTEPIAMPCEVVYTSRKAKGKFMADIGRTPDVWIDDAPYWICMDSA